MTDTLIRISCAETGDFSKLVLAPGLPMLDGKMLTYQVLQGWLHDLLAEPELDGDNVVFHALRGGERQQIVSRSMATDTDLAGTLASDFERLRKALFEIKPVSPSERLIFSRLQPPMGSHDGYLFKVRTVDDAERLVWCWGYQRRMSDGPLAICPNEACAALLVKQGGSAETCPHCHELLEKPLVAPKPTARKRTRPLGALIASASLLCAAVGTYFYAATAKRDVVDDEGLITGLEPRGLNAAELDGQSKERPETRPDELPEPSGLKTDDGSTASVTKSSRPSSDVPTSAQASRPRPPRPIPTDEGTPAVDVGSQTPTPSSDFKPFRIPRATVDNSKPTASKEPTPTKPQTSIIDPESSKSPSDVVITPKNPPPPLPLIPLPDLPPSKPTLPEVVTKTTPKTSPVIKTPDVIKTPEVVKPTKPLGLPTVSVSSDAGPSVEPSKPVIANKDATKPTNEPPKELVQLKPMLEGANNEPQVTQVPRKKVGDLQWHQDYLAGYQQAMQDKRMLVMLFHDASLPDHSVTRVSGFGAESLQPLLEKYVRISLPVNAVTPSADPNGVPSRLIEHRSFRHLKSQAGLAIVDLTDEQSANYGRVVSALPMPEDGRYSPEILETLLQLPTGSIGQRSLMLAVRTGVDGDNFTSGEANTHLHQMANRNARMMAQSDRVVGFDTDVRATAIRELFGDGVRIHELHFATEGPASVQEAAIQAVSKWLQDSEDRRALRQSSFAYGIELFQAPNSQRWFATCIILSR